MSMPEPDRTAREGRRWTRGERTLVATSVLLALNLVLLPWHNYSLDMGQLGVQVPSFSLRRTGVQSPYPAFGIAALIVALAMALHTVAHRLNPAVPRLDEFRLVAGAVVLGLVLGKLVANREFLGIGAWLGTALALGVAYSGFALSQESGGESDTSSRAVRD